MAVSPFLFHSSQKKAERQSRIEYYEEVSDECIAILMPHEAGDHVVLCMQNIAARQREIQDPSTSKERRESLTRRVQELSDGWMQHYKRDLSSIEFQLIEEEVYLEKLENQSE